MRFLSSIAVLAFVMTSGAGTMAADLPGFEVTGFPISPVQAQLLGAANIEEQGSGAVGTSGGAASPHQVSVLSPRPRQTAGATAPPWPAHVSSRPD